MPSAHSIPCLRSCYIVDITSCHQIRQAWPRRMAMPCVAQCLAYNRVGFSSPPVPEARLGASDSLRTKANISNAKKSRGGRSLRGQLTQSPAELLTPPSSLPSTSKATAGLRLGPTSPQPRGGTSVGKAGLFQAAQGSWRASVEVRGTAMWETGRQRSGGGRGRA